MPQRPARPHRPNYDQALKRLLTRAHDGVLALLAPDLRWRREVSPELPAVIRQVDLAWEVEAPDGERGLLHIELQTRAEPDLGERLVEYAVRLVRKEHLSVRSVVVMLRPGEPVPVSPYVVEWRGVERLRFVFDVVKLWEMPPELVLSTKYYELYPLATLMGTVTIESTLEIAERIATAPRSQSARTDLTALMVTLSELRLGRSDVLESLRRNPMIDEFVRGSVIAELFREEGRAQGIEEGRAQGIEQGRAQGREQGIEQWREQGMRDSIRTILTTRFRPLDDHLLSAIQDCHGAVLQELVVLSATGQLDQIRILLGQG